MTVSGRRPLDLASSSACSTLFFSVASLGLRWITSVGFERLNGSSETRDRSSGVVGAEVSNSDDAERKVVSDVAESVDGSEELTDSGTSICWPEFKR